MPWSKAGVMIRDSSSSDAANVSVVLEGMVLTRIISMAIRISDENNPTPIGMGKTFVDGIRLVSTEPK